MVCVDTALLLSPWRLIDVSSNARTSLPRDLRVRWSPKTRNEICQRFVKIDPLRFPESDPPLWPGRC